MPDYAQHPDLPPAEHEYSDIPVRGLGLAVAAVGVALALLAGLVVWLYPRSLADQTIAGSLPIFPAPALQASPRADMARFAARQLHQLNSAWWVDRAQGRVHLPIAQAMALVARQGIADWPRLPVDPTPRDAVIAQGTPAAAIVQRGMQRDVEVNALTPANTP